MKKATAAIKRRKKAAIIFGALLLTAKLLKMKISPEAHERLLKIRTYLFKRKTRKMRKELLASEMRTIRETHPEAVAENPDDWARLLKAVQS